MSADRMTGERTVTISFPCSGFEAASLEDAIDDYWEKSTDIRCQFAADCLGILVRGALTNKEFNYIIKKGE